MCKIILHGQQHGYENVDISGSIIKSSVKGYGDFFLYQGEDVSETSRRINGRRIYPFNKGLRIYGGGVYHPPFDTLNIGTSTDDIKLKLYR